MCRDVNEVINETAPFLLLLQRYYEGRLNKISPEEWERLVEALFQESGADLPHIQEGLAELKTAVPQSVDTMEYDFNRLFVGPDVLKAPPFESCCTGPERTLMDNTTMRVRAFYQKAGLQIIRKNAEPDDFMAFELEFVLTLFQQDTEESLTLAKRFLTEHLFSWYKKHLGEIQAYAQHPICRGMGNILQGTMEALQQSLCSSPQ